MEQSYFNPRSPCGERLVSSGHSPTAGSQFQSTLPVRGATGMPQGLPYGLPHFNPRSPCGERRAPSGGCAGAHDFNPRSPCGERREPRTPEEQLRDISIHAPRAGSDLYRLQHRSQRLHFNPRSPCGERHIDILDAFEYSWISIHAPRAGSDAKK